MHIPKIKTFVQVAMLAGGVAAQSASALDLGTFGTTDLTFKGYLKFDALATDTSDGSLAANSIGRDFFIPSTIPVSENGVSEGFVTDFHARQSRFIFATDTPIGDEHIKTYLELDFLVTSDGNEIFSNSFTSRVRHAYVTYGNFLFGQTWTTFMNVSSLPDTLDFIGNTDGTIFNRQPQIRYSVGNFKFALENPESTITPFGGGARITTDDNALPDFVARWDHHGENLHLAISGLVRQIEIDSSLGADDKTVTGGVSISGTYVFPNKDDLKFSLSGGSGLGRYIGLGLANGAVLDANNELEAIDSVGYSLSYRHHWNDQFRSTVVYSALQVDNDTDLTGFGVSRNSQSARVNLIYSPVKRLSIGGEVAYGNREIESGLDGSLLRLQFSARLDF